MIEFIAPPPGREGRLSGLVISLLDSKRSGFKTWAGHCVFLGNTLTGNSHNASLHQVVQMSTSKLSGKPDEMLEMQLCN